MSHARIAGEIEGRPPTWGAPGGRVSAAGRSASQPPTWATSSVRYRARWRDGCCGRSGDRLRRRVVGSGLIIGAGFGRVRRGVKRRQQRRRDLTAADKDRRLPPPATPNIAEAPSPDPCGCASSHLGSLNLLATSPARRPPALGGAWLAVAGSGELCAPMRARGFRPKQRGPRGVAHVP